MNTNNIEITNTMVNEAKKLSRIREIKRIRHELFQEMYKLERELGIE